MGAGQSSNTATNINENTFITNDTVNLLNKNLNEVATNTIVNTNQNCVSNKTIDLTQTFNRCKIKGSVNLNGTQKTVSFIDLGCIQKTNTQSHVGQAMMQEMMTDLQSKFKLKALNDMNTKAEAKSDVDLFSSNSSSSNEVNNINKLTSVSNNFKNIQNVLASAINSNFKAENIQNCIANKAVKQNLNMNDCEVIGDLNNDLEQYDGSKELLDCVNSSESSNNIIQNIISNLGIKTENNTDYAVSNSMKNDLSASSKSNGLFSMCGCDSLIGIVIWIFIGLIILAAIGGLIYYSMEDNGDQDLYQIDDMNYDDDNY